jgi:hypothetical protein
MSRRTLPALFAVLALCSIGGGVALAQTDEGEPCEEACSAQPAAQVDNRSFTTAELSAVLRRGLPFLCGNPADARFPDVDCKINAKITVPAKVAKYIGLHSRVLAHGVAGNRTNHYTPDRDDEGRAYFLEFTDAAKARLKAKHIRALGVLATGTITVKGADQILCGTAQTTRASCPLDYGHKANILGAADGELLCWVVMPWWVATKTKWGKMCPRPIKA